MSTKTSTPCLSIHSRAMPIATSALFRWSADRTSILMPAHSAFMQSSTAMRAARTDPLPARSE